MKKWIFLALSIFLIASNAQAANVVRAFTALTDNCTGCLDAVSQAGLVDGDIGIVVASGVTYFYYYDDNAEDAESSPSIIRPQDYDVGVWKLAGMTTTNVTTPAGDDPYVLLNELTGTDWYIGADDTGNTLELRTNVTVGNTVIMELNEDGTGLSVGDAGDDDITLTFNANSNDGTIQWMEDEEEFRIASGGGESLYIDMDTGTANEVGISTGSSVAQINLNAISLLTTGYITAAARYIPIDSTDADDSYTIATADGYGGVISNDGDDDALTVVLPDVAAGMTVCVLVAEAFSVVINPNGSERIIVDTNANGDSVTNVGTAGDYYCLLGITATEWFPMGKKGTWSDSD